MHGLYSGSPGVLDLNDDDDDDVYYGMNGDGLDSLLRQRYENIRAQGTL